MENLNPVQPAQTPALQPEVETKKAFSFSAMVNGNRGLMIGVAVVIVAAIIAIATMLNSGSSDKLQGLIRNVELQTQTHSQTLNNGDK